MPNTPINFTNLPKFKYGTTARINSTSNTPISNGSILIDIEAGKIYMDQNGERIHLNDIITVTDYSSLPASPENKIYRLNDTGDLYWPKNVSGSVTWINLCEKNESITIDTVLNASSNNAIANSAVTAALNGKADSSHTHSQSQITGLTTALSEKASASELAGVASRVSDLEANAGDMKKSIYDTDNDGVVERADVANSANSVAWNNVSGKPSTFTPSSHTHTSSAITDLNSAIATATSSKMDTPSGGSTGQVLTKTETGYAWATNASSTSVKPKLMLTKPVSTNKVLLVLEKSASPDSDFTEILNMHNNASDYTKVKVFDSLSGTFVTSDSDGIAPHYDNRTVLVDVEDIMDLGNYYRYKWVSIVSGGESGGGTGSGTTYTMSRTSGTGGSEGSGGSTVSDGWPIKIVVSNAASSYGEDVSAFNGDYVRTGETLSILGENVPIWSNGSKYIYGMSSGMGFDLDEPAIALESTTGKNDAQMSYAYRMKSDAPTKWTMADAANAILMTATITEVTNTTELPAVKYVYTVTGVTNPYEAANGDYYATGEMKNDYPVYTNGTYVMYYHPTDWAGWTLDKSNGSGPGIYKMQSTDPIGNWYPDGVVVSAYSGSSSGGESGGESGGSGDTSDETVSTDWYGGYYPSSDEQISNMADRLANAEAALNALGVTAVSVVTELPSNPDANTLYLIPES